MGRRYIRELADGEEVDEVFLASEKQLRTNRNGNHYLQLRLSDKSGSLVGMLWNANAGHYDALANGDYVRVRARAQVYNGGLQLILKSLAAVDPRGINSADYQTLSGGDVERLTEELAARLRQLADGPLRNLAEAFLLDERLMAQIKQAPAGVKHHHAYRGGLLQHIVALMKLADGVAGHYPRLDRDLLAVGVFLHDIGKLSELSYEPELGYTDAGQLLGHLVLAMGIIDDKIRQVESWSGESFPQDVANHLKHLVISHHGQYEFGSPKLPMSHEALVLHALDTLDSKLHAFDQLIDEDLNPDSAWTVYHAALGRKIYKGSSRGGAPRREANDAGE